MKLNQKPCRHLASISLNNLSLHLSQISSLNQSECDASCKNFNLIGEKEKSCVYTCLTCLQGFCNESSTKSSTNLIHHARTQKHPLSFHSSLKESSSDFVTQRLIETEFYCAICAGNPKIRSSHDRVTLERVKSLFLENQNNPPIDEVCIYTIENENYSSKMVEKNSKSSRKVLVVASDSNVLDSDSDDVPRGLINLGNTCFMNSALQLLAATLKRHGDLKAETGDYLSSASDLFNSLLYHLKGIYETAKPNNSKSNQSKSSKSTKKQLKNQNNSNSLNPKEFLSILSGKQKKFAALQQQDAHDFLRLLFNSLSQGLDSENNSENRNRNISRDELKVVPPQVELFGGKFVSRVICEKCKKVSDTSEPFLDISLSLPQQQQQQQQQSQSQSHPSLDSSMQSLNLKNDDEYCDEKYVLNLNKLLMNWNKKIRLEGENGYYCEFCAKNQNENTKQEQQQQLQSATLQYFLSSTPPFLILHLQRFKTFLTLSTGSSKGNNKSSSKSKCKREEYSVEISKDRRAVQFPLNLSLSPDLLITSPSPNSCVPQYRLYGYIIHEGSSTTSGHYTAMICTQKSNRWFYVSDALVKEIPGKEALDGNLYPPYLLFYQKENM